MLGLKSTIKSLLFLNLSSVLWTHFPPTLEKEHFMDKNNSGIPHKLTCGMEIIAQ
jgi:hypothetical protein